MLKQGEKKLAAISFHICRVSPVLIFLLFTLWSLVLTYPLGLHPFSHIPQGDEKVGTVPLFNLWTLQWNIDQLMQGYPNYWNAPIFAPSSGTFAFSETQPVSAWLAAPLWLALQSPPFGYNAVVILFLTFNGWFAYWLLRSWEVTKLAAFLAGLMTQSMPFVAQELGVLQLIAIFGILWSLFYLGRFLRQRNRGRIGWQNSLFLALGTPVTFFTCSYYGLLSIFFVPLALVFQFRREHFRFKTLGLLLLIALLVLALSAPFLWAQRQRLADHGFTRSAQIIESNSARLQYYKNFLGYNILYSRLLGLKSDAGQRLFPGFGLIVLACLGLFGRRQEAVRLYLLLAIVLALALSLGLRLNIGGFTPYQWIREYIPGFGQLRSPFRFAALVQLHLVLLAGFGLHNLGCWFSRQKMLIMPLIASLAIFESLAIPLPLQMVPPMPNATPWQTWLNEQEQPPRIVILPFAGSNRVADFEQTTHWMLQNRHFHGDMVNGYSGFFPPDHGQVRDLMLKFPTPAGIDLLNEKGVDYVVVHHDLAEAPQIDLIKQSLNLAYLDERSRVAIYSLNGRN